MRPCLGTWLVVAMVCVAGAAGCTSWKKQTATADVLLRPPDPPRELCVTLVDGSRLALRSPVIRGDSVVGRPGYVQQITKEDRSGWGNRTSVRAEPKVRAWSRADTVLALADIAAIETREPDEGETAVLVLGTGVVAGLIATWIALSTWDGL